MTIPPFGFQARLMSFFLAIAFTSALPAQLPRAAGFSFPVHQLEPLILPIQDNTYLQEQEMERRQTGHPPRFAVAIPVQITPASHGRWDQAGAISVWRIRLRSPDAYSLNLGFSQYHMPEGGKLYIYDPGQENRRGPFTPADNESHNELWTPIFPGDELIIEIQVPSSKRSELTIELAVVNHDFLGFGQLNSGSCNLDIICGTADGWDIIEPFRDASRSVGLYSLQGSLLCTGFLVNNTQQDCTPYFLTANHCEITAGNAASVVVYWNYENSSCRQPDSFESGQSGDGQLNDFNTGAVFRSSWANSDFCLIELDDPVSETANAFFAGWSALDEIPLGTVASIHHPFTDEKRISLSDNPVHFGFWGSGEESPDGNHLIVTSWTSGTTQSGSSGGPLFNNRGQAIGQLHGGDAACGNDNYDSFGRMHNSWEGGGTPDSRLKDWLDPMDLGTLSLDGREQGRCDFLVLGAFSFGDICAGTSDTLHLSFGSGFEAIPELEIGAIDQALDIIVQELSNDISTTRSFLWSTSENTPAGKYTFEIYTTYEGITDTTYYQLEVTGQSPNTPVLLTPPDLAEGQPLQIALKWIMQKQIKEYRLQVATDPDFTTILSDEQITQGPEAVISSLEANTTYYWRVAADNSCGAGDWSIPNSFTTADLKCSITTASDGPIDIPSSSVSTINSSLILDISGTIASIEVANLDIRHNWVGDLSIVLRSPSGKEVALLDRLGFPSSLFGCDGSDLFLNFNQDLGNSYQSLESTCGSNQPSISGTFKPLESLQTLIGERAAGTWTLVVKDQAEEDGGILISWALNICTLPEEVPVISGLSDTYNSCVNDSLQIELVISEAFEGQAVALSLDPAASGATVNFSKNPAAPGDTVNLLLRNFTSSGSFPFELLATDGANNAQASFDLEIGQVPALVELEAPAAASTLSDASTTFTWTDVGALSYRLEIASDPDFVVIINTVETTAPFYTLDLPGQEGEFYWRVTAANTCGRSTSNTFSFIFTTSATSEFQDGQQVRVYPNPFSDLIQLAFTRALDRTVPLRLFDINGRLLYTDVLTQGSMRKTISLDQLPAGIYLLELRYKGQRYVERMVRVGGG